MRLPQYTVYRRMIAKIIGDPEEAGMQPTAPIVAMYVEGWMPDNCPNDENAGYYMSSAEIAGELKDMCELSTTDVATVMLHLGFRMFSCDDGRFAWAMVPPSTELLDKYKKGGDE